MSSRNLALVIGVIVLLALAGFFVYSYQQKASQTAVTTDSSPESQTMAPLPSPDESTGSARLPNSHFVLLEAQNDSGQDGEVTITPSGTSLRVVLTVANPVREPQPAHIHLGSCPNPGAVKYPLTNVVNGRSETTLRNVSLEAIDEGLPLAVNVHKSATQSAVYTSCGDLATP